MTQPNKPSSDKEYERLNPGASADPPQRPTEPDQGKGRPTKNDAALPGSQNADLRGAKRDRTFRGATT
jgi:hypothetical protein